MIRDMILGVGNVLVFPRLQLEGHEPEVFRFWFPPFVRRHAGLVVVERDREAMGRYGLTSSGGRMGPAFAQEGRLR